MCIVLTDKYVVNEIILYSNSRFGDLGFFVGLVLVLGSDSN